MGEQLNVKVSSLKLKKMMLTALLAVGFIATASAEEARSPVGKLMDPNGAVEYSRDGEKWRPPVLSICFQGITSEPVRMARVTSLIKNLV